MYFQSGSEERPKVAKVAKVCNVCKLTDEQEEKISAFLQRDENTFMYDLKHRDHMNKSRNAAKFVELGGELGLSPDLAKQVYKSIRTQFAKFIIPKSGAKGDVNMTHRRQQLVDRFQFLKVHVHRKVNKRPLASVSIPN